MAWRLIAKGPAHAMLQAGAMLLHDIMLNRLAACSMLASVVCQPDTLGMPSANSMRPCMAPAIERMKEHGKAATPSNAGHLQTLLWDGAN